LKNISRFIFYSACQVCTPNATNTVWSHCQCVLADGVERGILTVNRMIPGPSIQVCDGDRVVIDVENHMEGMEVTIHWHGIWQRGTQYYDGVPFVTQCPIQQGNTFRYLLSHFE
jgi:FtsP/CotA-like multicopper oxidase with cupredoxin domain